MVRTVEFGSRDAANNVRDRIKQFLAPSDSRVSKTVKIQNNIPDSIFERVESEAFQSRESNRTSYGKEKLTESEQQTLKRTTSFTWQQHGFEAMAAKAALQAKGVDTWTDYYEPGEGVESSLSKLRQGKQRAQQTRASSGIESMRTDEEDVGNIGRRSQQAERAQSKQAERAKRPGIVGLESDAIDFLQEEQQFTDDVFDLSFSGDKPSGADFELLEERHENRSERAQNMDERLTAEITRDPIEWTQNPGQYDFPDIDTVDPMGLHQQRPQDERERDEAETAPIADTKQQWALDMDGYDWPGVDTKR